MTKICTKCGESKPRTTENWYVIRSYFASPCKTCRLVKPSEDDALRRRERQRAQYAQDPEKYKAKEKRRRQEKGDRVRAVERERRRRTADTRSSQRTANRLLFRDEINAKVREDRAQNPQKYRSYYRYNEPTKMLNARVGTQMRKHLQKVGEKKTKSKCLITGWEIEDLVVHLKDLFEGGMSLENYGEWEIDHIVPLSLIPFTSEDDPLFVRAWGLENLAPLWATDNNRKRNSLTWSLPETYKNVKMIHAYAHRDLTLLLRSDTQNLLLWGLVA